MVTYESENTDADLVARINKSKPVYPGENSLRRSQHRLIEKNTFRDHGIKTANFLRVTTKDELIKATKELYGHFITKSIWTREKFEDLRIDLAANEWRRMKSTNSQECRNCHNFEYMDFTAQENRAADNHQVALDEGKTCIDCHQGIAHELPEGWQDRYEQVVQEMAAAGELTLPDGRQVADAKGEIEGFLTSGN